MGFIHYTCNVTGCSTCAMPGVCATSLTTSGSTSSDIDQEIKVIYIIIILVLILVFLVALGFVFLLFKAHSLSSKLESVKINKKEGEELSLKR